uniref:Activin_recp domain-containing protein n=1 Tax=Caenorhabditis tropicalis TaxID=1561998 RepID=A0A1I7URQ7_9PELO
MSFLLKCILVLTIVNYIAAAQSSRQRNSGLVRCHKEVGSSVSTCEGKYCYKMRTPDDTTDGGIVKKGCMNAADAQTEVGKCTRRPLEEGESELMCVCNERDFCNSAPAYSLTAVLIIAAMLLF